MKQPNTVADAIIGGHHRCASAAGFHIFDEDGPFGPVVVTAAAHSVPHVQAIEEVTNVVLNEPLDENWVLLCK